MRGRERKRATQTLEKIQVQDIHKPSSVEECMNKTKDDDDEDWGKKPTTKDCLYFKTE
jgi:hypothetical protein